MARANTDGPVSIWKTKFAKNVAPASRFAWAASLNLLRQQPFSFTPRLQKYEAVDLGCNYFVLMLEQMGAVTHGSCEGHPWDFYVMFDAPLWLGSAIARTNTFHVDYFGCNRFSIGLNTTKIGGVGFNLKMLEEFGTTWESEFMPLEVDKVQWVRPNPLAYVAPFPKPVEWVPSMLLDDAEVITVLADSYPTLKRTRAKQMMSKEELKRRRDRLFTTSKR